MRTALYSALGVMLMLSACAKPPSQTRNACAIFEQLLEIFLFAITARAKAIESSNDPCRAPSCP